MYSMKQDCVAVPQVYNFKWNFLITPALYCERIGASKFKIIVLGVLVDEVSVSVRSGLTPSLGLSRVVVGGSLVSPH